MVNLKNDSKLLATEENGPTNSTSSTQQRPRKKQRTTVMSAVDGYAVRHHENMWSDKELFDEYHGQLDGMSLFDFLQLFYVGQRGKHQNKIREHCGKGNPIIRYIPSLSSSKDHPNYAEYCRYALMKYKPWYTDVEELWDDADPDDEKLIQEWEKFVGELATQNKKVPDRLKQQIDAFKKLPERQQSNILNGLDNAENDAMEQDQLEQNDWMKIASEMGDQIDAVDPDAEGAVQWDCNFDPTHQNYSYKERYKPVENIEEFWNSQVVNGNSATNEIVNPNVTLKEMQQIAVDCVMASFQKQEREDDGNGQLMILLGKGGTGKTTTLETLNYQCKTKYGSKSVLNLATTGRAATLIPDGATLHNAKRGLGIPLSGKEYIPMKGSTLKNRQKFFKGVKLVIIDEFSMLRQSELSFINLRLQEAMNNTNFMGGCVVLLSGDPGQLPPVGGRAIWDPSYAPTEHDKAGQGIYNMTQHVIELQKVSRANADDEDAEFFVELQERIRDGTTTESDWRKVISKCAEEEIGAHEWKQRFVDASDVTHLFGTNIEVLKENHSRLKNLKCPIVQVRAKNTGQGSKWNDTGKFRGLEHNVYLAHGAKIFINQNLATQYCLSNGTTGVIKDLVYGEGVSPPDLPDYVWVDCGDEYKGPNFFPDCGNERKGWVPIFPVTCSEHTVSKKKTNPDGSTLFEEHTRTMLPMQLAWAWTHWKSQGQTIRRKIVIHLGKHEKEAGTTYVDFSRGDALTKYGIAGGCSLQRLTTELSKHVKLQVRLNAEKWLRRLAKETIEFVEQARQDGYVYVGGRHSP